MPFLKVEIREDKKEQRIGLQSLAESLADDLKLGRID
jgi:hypothetical protein